MYYLIWSMNFESSNFSAFFLIKFGLTLNFSKVLTAFIKGKRLAILNWEPTL